jgi:hypothetical protein
MAPEIRGRFANDPLDFSEDSAPCLARTFTLGASYYGVPLLAGHESGTPNGIQP